MRSKGNLLVYDVRTFESFVVEKIAQSVPAEFTDEQKYKYIFDWCVRQFNYNYGHSDEIKAALLCKSFFSKNKKLIKYCIRKIPKYSILFRIKKTEEVIRVLESIPDISEELIDLKRKELKYWQSAREFEENNNLSKTGSLFETKFGVCEDFAKAYRNVCKKVRTYMRTNLWNSTYRWN